MTKEEILNAYDDLKVWGDGVNLDDGEGGGDELVIDYFANGEFREWLSKTLDQYAYAVALSAEPEACIIHPSDDSGIKSYAAGHKSATGTFLANIKAKTNQ